MNRQTNVKINSQIDKKIKNILYIDARAAPPLPTPRCLPYLQCRGNSSFEEPRATHCRQSYVVSLVLQFLPACHAALPALNLLPMQKLALLGKGLYCLGSLATQEGSWVLEGF